MADVIIAVPGGREWSGVGQWGVGRGRRAITFGLSVYYEVFLLSRIRERWLVESDPRGSVAEGFQRTGGIVTMAALLIAVVLTGLVFSGFAPIKAIGLGQVKAIGLGQVMAIGLAR